MAVATSNRFLPLLAAAVLLMLVFVTLRACSEDDGEALVMDSVPEAPAPDADTPADTIKTLTTNVAAMTTELETLRQDNASLRRENQALLRNRSQIEENVATRLQRAREKDAANQARIDAGALAALTAKVDALAAAVDAAQARPAAPDLPIGIGLDRAGDAPEAGIVWIASLDAVEDAAEEGGGLLGRTQRASSRLLEAARTGTAAAVDGLEDRVEDLQPQPVYTVPRNATLIGATAMTALVGRIPLQGEVRDHMPFKAITGADNLAANGLRVPGVQGMVWSGTAVGDWTLSCVTGRLESVTFVFDDGTLRTLASDDHQGGGEARPLGSISDAQGIPCVSGARKTTAPSFLAQRMGVTALQAAGQAAAAAQTTAFIGEGGDITQALTGDTGSYRLGKTLAGGGDAAAQWLLARQAQSFDAVFVPAGTRLAIDRDPRGRRLQHATAHPRDPRQHLD